MLTFRANALLKDKVGDIDPLSLCPKIENISLQVELILESSKHTFLYYSELLEDI